jgi:predicted N-acetyltransferase YhbS
MQYMSDSTNAFAIVNLVDHAELGSTLAHWHTQEWGHLYDPTIWNREIAKREFAEMQRHGIPLTFVALDPHTHALLGSISLIADDELSGYEHLTPWLASLYVVPKSRGIGIARALIDAVLSAAMHQGYDTVYLFTSGQERYYAERGWAVVARTFAYGHDAAVMAHTTFAVAPTER